MRTTAETAVTLIQQDLGGDMARWSKADIFGTMQCRIKELELELEHARNYIKEMGWEDVLDGKRIVQ